jgi:hypothetical protein
MKTRTVAALGIILLASQTAFADASYQSTSQVSGGTLVEQLRSIPFVHLTENNFAPTNTLIMVHGNQKAVVTKDSTEIIDLDKETITRIDTAQKTYTVVTFAQMRQALANMPKQMQEAQARMQQAQQPRTDLKTSFDVSVKDTGVTKVVNGLNAQEKVITLQMHGTNPSVPASGVGNTVTYVVTTDVWVAPDPPEMKEIEDFDLRAGQKMMSGWDLPAFAQGAKANASARMAALLGAQPGSAEAMAQMGKELAKLKGMRVLEITSISGNGQTIASAPLMQMKTEKTNFSQEAIPPSVFQVPSGYTKVQSPFERMGK